MMRGRVEKPLLLLVVLASLISSAHLPQQVFSQNVTGCSATQCEERIQIERTCLSFASTFHVAPDTTCPYPTLTYVQNGITKQIAMTLTIQTIYADIGSIASAPYTIYDPSGDAYHANESTSWTIMNANEIHGPSYAYYTFTPRHTVVWALYCQPTVYVYAGSLVWYDAGQFSAHFANFTDFSQVPTGNGYTFGIGCDPKEPATNMTIERADGQGVFLTIDGTSANGTVYGVLNYGYLGVPAETVFSEKTTIERSNYFTSYSAFIAAFAPAVYVNSTSQSIEWSLPDTRNSQDIYFTNGSGGLIGGPFTYLLGGAGAVAIVLISRYFLRRKKRIAYVDAGYRKETGGYIAWLNETTGETFYNLIDCKDSFRCEFAAILHFLENAKGLQKTDRIQIRCDNNTVVHQLNHEYAINEDDIREYAIRVWSFNEKFSQPISYVWIPRAENKAGKILGS